MFGLKATSEPAPGDGLGSSARRRLDRFARAFDAIDAKELRLFAGPAEPDHALDGAMVAADRVLGSGIERAATKRAVQTFVKAAQVRFVEDFNVLTLLGVGARDMASAEERVRVFKSLERAIVALVVWDRLDPTEQAALAGPWADLVEVAVEAE